MNRITRSYLVFFFAAVSIAIVAVGCPGSDDSQGPLPSEIVINEVLVSTVGPSGIQWVELSNTGNASQELDGWSLVNGQGTTLADLSGWRLPAGAFLVISFSQGNDDRDFSDGVGAIYNDALQHPLDAQGGELGLYSGQPNEGTIVDFAA